MPIEQRKTGRTELVEAAIFLLTRSMGSIVVAVGRLRKEKTQFNLFRWNASAIKHLTFPVVTRVSVSRSSWR